MCGILGYSGIKPANISDLKILFLYSETRGSHATGYATKDEVLKSNDASPYFIAKNKIPSSKLIIGHTRNPSTAQGDAEYNAQPFDFEKIVGAHNGLIGNHYELRQKLNTEVKYSDSYHGLSLINKVGGEEAIPQIRGSFALVWIDKENETLNLYRNKKPILMGRKDKGVFVASEGEFLEAIDCENIVEIPEHKIITIKDGKTKKDPIKVEPKQWGYHRGSGKSDENTCGFQTHNNNVNDRSSGVYGNKKHIENYNEEVESNVVIKLKPVKAPKDAKSLFFNGYIHYYWQEGTNLYIETLKSATSSDKVSYNLGYESAYNEAEKHFKPILDKIV